MADVHEQIFPSRITVGRRGDGIIVIPWRNVIGKINRSRLQEHGWLLSVTPLLLPIHLAIDVMIAPDLGRFFASSTLYSPVPLLTNHHH